ncbi:MAG: diguanylate cyclase [Rubrivivax sp.]|nr:MAG: diguanylate cyclase [Rubrivivax sp.]
MAAEDGPQWADLIGRISRGLERSNRQWTAARKKDSLQRVLAGSRLSSARLLQRLQQLVGAWDSDQPDAPATDLGLLDEAAAGLAGTVTPPDALNPVRLDLPAMMLTPTNASIDAPPPDTRAPVPAADDHVWVARTLASTLAGALPSAEAQTTDAQAALEQAVARALASEALPVPADITTGLNEACGQTRRIIEHRHHLVDQLVGLCQSLTESLADLAEDDSWVRGQCVVMRAELDEGMSGRNARRIQQLLEDTREKQKSLRLEREAARQALKAMIQQMLGEIAQMGHTTGQFQSKLVGYAETIGQADSLHSLTGVVRDMVEESRAVHGVISQAQERLSTEHARATELTERVRHLEDEIRKLSDEVSTDPLTQIANRRGLMRAFEGERSRVERQGGSLAIGLLDVDNFKKLNDTLGHQTGDEALKFLSRRVSESLRPSDSLARYGGEEFVVLLPDTPVEEGQVVLTRLQRLLSAELFTEGEHKVFITFSAGVTQYRADEPIEAALDRADMALYEAKRTGKNRTCVG